MVRIVGMADRILRLDRRELLAGLGAAALVPVVPRPATAQGRPSISLQAMDSAIALRPGGPDTPIWTLDGPDLRFRRGETPDIAFGNRLPVPAVAGWRGINGVALAEPLAARAPLAPGAKDIVSLPLRHAGTFLCDLRLLGDGQARPSPVRALIVGESEPVAVDRDEVLLIEDWRLRADGTAIAPGTAAGDTTALFTVNGRATQDIPVRGHERLRFRFINGCQRNVVAVKIEGHEVRVMAFDGQPAEPFLARGGGLVLAPGSRVDAFVDASAPPGSIASILLHDGQEARPIARLVTSKEPAIRNAPLPTAAPLPSNGLPAQLDLKSA
jgi:FtsP/CotA-like multicopper oxidase with cupredoxin domain